MDMSRRWTCSGCGHCGLSRNVRQRRWRVDAIAVLLLLAAGAATQPAPPSAGESSGAGPGGRGSCGDEHLSCVRLADPLLTDAALVFPVNMADVHRLCASWRAFVKCVKEYTGRCFSVEQQEAFVRAVQGAVGLVQRLCSELRYQEEYLQYAVCIHSTVSSGGRCSSLYGQLVEHVLGEVDEKTLCCSHRHFEGCVLEEVGRVCNSGNSDAAKTFARELLDKAFNYIKTACSDSDPYTQNCLPRHLGPSNRALNRSETSDKDGSDSSAQQPHANNMPVLPHSGDEEEQSPWQPGKTLDAGPHTAPNPEGSDTQARANPSRSHSHGRGINWAPSNVRPPSPDQPAGGFQGTHDNSMWTASSSHGSPKPQSPNPTQVWYPWGKMNNVVDEPNQQGLAGKDIKKGNTAARKHQTDFATLFALTIIASCLI